MEETGVALFQCESTFEIPERRLFVLAGQITSGIVKVGMQILIPFNSQVSMAMEIHSIEQINSTSHEAKLGICHVVEADDDLAMLIGLNIGGELLKIVEPESCS
jgi:hypothetical protein